MKNIKSPTVRHLLNLLVLIGISVLVSCCEKTEDVVEYGSLTGTVRDALTNDPIAGVSVYTNPASNSVVSDENGNFVISRVPAGAVTLTARKLDYKVYTVNIQVQADKNTEMVLILEKSEGYSSVSGTFSDPFPGNGATGQALPDTVWWQFLTSAQSDSLTYDLRFFESPGTEPFLESLQLSDTFALVSGLRYHTTYYWQVSAINGGTTIAYSELWSFTTVDLPDNPILFARSTADNYDIWSVDTAGVVLSPITQAGANMDWYPRSNPVNGRIAFVSNRQLEPQIYTMNSRGEDVVKVTTLAITGNYNEGTGFCWSPDGSMLLYPHYDKLYRVNQDGTGLTQIATAPAGRNFTACDWSHYTGKIIVQTTGNNPYDNELYLMDEDGSNVELFIDNLPGVIQNPVFSIDGLRVMYTRDADGLDLWDGRQLNSHIYMRAINDTVVTDLSADKPDGTNDLMPRFSPDGSMIIFVNTGNVPGSPMNIMISDLKSDHRSSVIEDGTMPEWR